MACLPSWPLWVLLSLSFVTLCFNMEQTLYSFWPKVPVGKFRDIQRSITQFNCKDKAKANLRMPFDLVSQVPKFNELPGMIYYPNRTGLIHLHNMALNRAFFFSYIIQKFNKSREDSPYLPGLLYTYLSTAADVTSNPTTVNSSVLMYGVHSFYPNFYTTMPFNTTLNLFAIRAIRIDNTFQTANFIREPTLNTIRMYDLGAQMGQNYTWPSYRFAPWYGKGPNTPDFLPDSNDRNTVGLKTHRYVIDIRWTPTEKTGSSFFGPPYTEQLEQNYLPVRFTQPWFDCGDENKAFNEWITSAVSPVVDYMPRYGTTPRIQFPKYVAVAAMDTFFIKIPQNLCPIAEGNPAPNLVASSDICKSPSTVCEPIIRNDPIQFRRSSFECRCNAGYRYPYPYRESPWPGDEYHKATEREYKRYYDCEPVRNRMVWPTTDGLTDQGDKAGVTEVRLTRRRRDTNATLFHELEEWMSLNTTHDRHDTHTESDKQDDDMIQQQEAAKHLRQMKERIAYVDDVIKTHYNVTDVDEILQHDLDYDAMKRETRKLVSTFSRPDAPPRKLLRSRFNADWLTTTVDEDTPRTTHNKHKKHKKKILSRHKRATNEREVTFNTYQYQQTRALFQRFKDINAVTCKRYKPIDLIMPNGAAFGATTQFHAQASMALRLAHFLSAFLQLNKEQVVSSIKIGQRLHEHHVIGEALGNVAGDIRMISSGVFFERNKFVDSKGVRREFFGPLVYRKGDLAAASFQTRDMARFGQGYHQETWFKTLKERWATNPYGLERFRLEPFIRPTYTSQSQDKLPFYPMIFHAPRMTDGYWSEPYFDCNGPVPKWLITYSAPFFGMTGGRLTFMGVVTASVELHRLDVNQCAGNFYETNYFKDTALCDPVSTYCTPVVGYGFQWGSYRCHCRAGYEFPFLGIRYFYLGTLMETEYNKRLRKEPNIFGILKCRQTSGSFLRPSVVLVQVLVVLSVAVLQR